MKLQRMYLVFLLLVMSVTTSWSAPLKTHVAEFNVSGAAKPEEVRSIIQTLLLSRLAGDRIATQGAPQGAEITVSGSYLLSGGMFSLDAAAVNSSGAVVTRAFTQGKAPDDLIPAIGTLAKSLADGINKVVTQSAATPAPAAAALVPLADAPAADIIIAPKSVSAAKQAGVHRMTGALSSLAVGRTLPGGERELFVAGNNSLRYYRQGAGLKLVAEISYKVNEKILAVDSADLDNDMVPEIYVTVMNGEVLASQVWKVDGTALKQIAGPLPYYFRAVSGAGGVKKLYAQQLSGTADFAGDVAEVVRVGGGYELKNPLKLPKGGSLYNFGILRGPKGEASPVVVDNSGFVRVFNSGGDELWKSSEAYGGSETYFKRTEIGGQRSSDSGERQVYLTSRMIVKGDGELLVAKNSESWFMKNKHSYSKSSLYCFAWNGSDLEEKWHTQQNDYYLADFAYDENNRELLLLEVVDKEEGLFDKGASRLVVRKVD
ncbi:MAG: FG-GAP repeat domain-containing protein [Desulfuromonadaceae bacterium]